MFYPFCYFYQKNNNMIVKEQFLNGIDPVIREAITLFHYGLGRSYDIQIMYGKMNEDQFHCLEKQGGELNSVNKLRDSLSLKKLNPLNNIPVVKKKWGKNLIAGTGVVFTVQKKVYRYKLNRDIETVMEWFGQLKPELKMDTFTNDQFTSIFIGYNLKETKEDVPKEAAPNEQI